MVKYNKDLVISILWKHGFKCERFEPISTGKFNDSFICYLVNGKYPSRAADEAVVLRVAPPDDAGFLFYERNMMAQEQGLHRIIKEKTSIPVPEIFVYDNSRKFIDRDYLIMEYLPGTPLSEAWISHSLQEKVFEQTGRYLRELHTNCVTNQFGYLGEHHPMEPQNRWDQAFRIMWNKLIDDIVSCGVYQQTDAELARQALEKHFQLFNRDIPSSLLHMDIWSQNILIDEQGNITGIVDWDRALWGDPEIEFAVLDYCGFNNAAFWRGYGLQPENSRERRIRMMFYHLYEVQKYLVIYTLRRSNPGRVQQYKLYSLDSLKQLIKMN